MKNILKRGPTKSKEQIAFEMKQKAHFERMKKIAREDIYPVVQKYAKNAKHAENTLQIFKSVITIMMQKPYKDMTIGGLQIREEITGDESVEDRDFHIALCEALNEVSIADAAKLLEGMAGSINGVTNKRAGEAPFDLTVDDITY
jgi:hypothetical protein